MQSHSQFRAIQTIQSHSHSHRQFRAIAIAIAIAISRCDCSHQPLECPVIDFKDDVHSSKVVTKVLQPVYY